MPGCLPGAATSGGHRSFFRPSPCHACRWLGSVELNGTLPTEGWDALPSLAELNLSFNNLHGSLPATLPASLQQIYLQSNALTAIDPAWRPGARLKDLRIYDNQLNQSLTDQQGWLTSAQGLEELRLEGNKLHGTIPAGLALPPRLAQLWLSNNRLSGANGLQLQLRVRVTPRASVPRRLSNPQHSRVCAYCHGAGSLPPIALPDSLQELRLNEVCCAAWVCRVPYAMKQLHASVPAGSMPSEPCRCRLPSAEQPRRQPARQVDTACLPDRAEHQQQRPQRHDPCLAQASRRPPGAAHVRWA